ncbi:HTTM domain-containing protein [Sorangium sp. So ce291]|uniref:HTTM domain-containing protein n=1 Tax=Sorangium sp. So ce291 TaxID=3133294 RepID=UPI003F5DEA99
MRQRTHTLRLPGAREAAARLWGSMGRFAFAPASARPLAALRIGLASVLLMQAALIAPIAPELYSRSGIVQGQLLDGSGAIGFPRIGHLVSAFSRLGVGESSVIAGVGVLYVLSLAGLLLGWRTRFSAACAWLVHFTLMMTAERTNYGADQFANIFLFYLVFMPSGAALSLDRVFGRAPPEPSAAARLALRVVQLHLCLVYLSSGVEKALGSAWWDGDAIWRTLMLPEYRRFDFSWLADHAWIAVAAGWMVLLVETGYPFFIWPRRTRRLWVAATVGLHLGIAVFMRLDIFGAIMSVFTIAAFGVKADPRQAREPSAAGALHGRTGSAHDVIGSSER